jgi:hypothetical protein
LFIQVEKHGIFFENSGLTAKMLFQHHQTHQITANDIASRLLRVSKVPIDRSHVRSTRRSLRERRRELSIDQSLSADFTLAELDMALIAVKSGKAAGFDGVYPEFIKNSGTKTKE